MHSTWNPDANPQPVDPEQQAREDAALRDYQRINAECNADPEFTAQLQKLLKAYPQLREATVRMYAGTPRLDGTRCTTALQCCEAALGKAVDLELVEHQGRGGARRTAATEEQIRKRGQQEEFRQQWEEYILACQARKQRIEAARVRCHAEQAEARARYAVALREPVPVPPKRPE